MRVVYCSPQLDGLAAAAIIFRASKLGSHDVRFGGVLTHDTAAKQFAAMATHAGDLIFILDFLPDNLQDFKKHLDAIIVRNRIAYWNSHQPHDAQIKEMLGRYAHTIELAGPEHYQAMPKEKICAAELAHYRFLPYDSVAKELARLANDNEFWKRADVQATKLADLIASGMEPKELIETLSRGVLWSERFEHLHREYVRKKQEALADILRHLVIKNIAGINFGFTLAPTLLASADAGQHVLDSHTSVDISVIIYRNGRVSFRKRDENTLNLAELAKLFGGGGHAYAAGARLSQFSSVTFETFGTVVFALDQKLKEHFLAMANV
jgi:oligoribonuclease NrnB/cAMP/cGMP phosphodiesterase (DHH superfamily)